MHQPRFARRGRRSRPRAGNRTRASRWRRTIARADRVPRGRDGPSGFPDAPRAADGVGVDVHRVVDVARVAAGHRQRDRDRARRERREHVLVAAREAALGEPEPPEAVVLVGIGAREVEDELGARALERLVQAALEVPQVLVVARAVGELDVEVASPPSRTGSCAPPWIEKVNTAASPAKIAALPLPWCTSQSTIAMRASPASACIARAAMAASLKTQ